MLTSRDQILRNIRGQLPVASAMPNLDHAWTQYDDPVGQFLEILRGVGGVGKVVNGQTALRKELAQLAAHIQAEQVCSLFPDACAGNVDLNATHDPHELASVDLAILPGELAVAENAAVWVTGARVRQRVAYFLSQHVALVVPADRIVNNMHEAYEWLHSQAEPGRPFDAAQWGTFMSGPSKTADIEQALVIGAHGARSLHVLLLDD